ncbi:MAG: SRPBCC family protein [Catenulispora sp.]|nr:SRPBCC family protein [Catenulispora sp.]
MSLVEASVDVDVPVTMAYNQWTQFESFPEFMNGVEQVRQLDNLHNHWVLDVSGVRREFDTEITEQRPDERISWKTVGGDLQQIGNVSFERLDETHSRVTVQLEWEPEGLAEKTGSAVGLDTRQVRADAERFKHFIEHRNAETGAWRGEIGPQTETRKTQERGAAEHDPM